MSKLSKWWAELFDCPIRKNKEMKDDTRKINEVFCLPNNVKLKVCENTEYLGRCNGCYFRNSGECVRTVENFRYTGCCSESLRTDKKPIIFKEIKENKIMKKSDLKLGNIVECRNGNVYMLVEIRDTKVLICKDNPCEPLTLYDAYLHNVVCSEFDIMKVYSGCPVGSFEAMLYWNKGKLIWERNEITELTLEDVAKKFNIDVKNLRIKD